MKREDFILQLAQRERQWRKGTFAGFMLVGLCLLAAAVTDFLKEHNYLGAGNTQIIQNFFLGLTLLSMFAFIVLALASKRGVPCPNCHKNLFGIPAQIVVATGVCGHCGKKAFD